MENILCKNEISGEDESTLQDILAQIHAKRRMDPPSKFDHATTAIQVLEWTFNNVPQTTFLRMRMTTIDAIEYHYPEWLQEQFGDAIVIKCSVAGEAAGKQVGAANRVELYISQSGHRILARDSHWNMYGVTMSNPDDALDSIRSYSDDSAFMSMFGFLDEAQRKCIEERMISHSQCLWLD